MMLRHDGIAIIRPLKAHINIEFQAILYARLATFHLPPRYFARRVRGLGMFSRWSPTPGASYARLPRAFRAIPGEIYISRAQGVTPFSGCASKYHIQLAACRCAYAVFGTHFIFSAAACMHG